MKSLDYFYLAAPYSHDSPRVMDDRLDYVTAVAASVYAHGVVLFSPLTHSVPLEATGLIDGGHAYDAWRLADHTMLWHARGLVILTLDGWEESVGVMDEWEHAQAWGKPTLFLEGFDYCAELAGYLSALLEEPGGADPRAPH